MADSRLPFSASGHSASSSRAYDTIRSRGPYDNYDSAILRSARSAALPNALPSATNEYLAPNSIQESSYLNVGSLRDNPYDEILSSFGTEHAYDNLAVTDDDNVLGYYERLKMSAEADDDKRSLAKPDRALLLKNKLDKVSALGVFDSALLQSPLLPVNSDEDHDIALCVNVAILRFMGDFPPSKVPFPDRIPIMDRLAIALGLSRTRLRSLVAPPVADTKSKDPQGGVFKRFLTRMFSKDDSSPGASPLLKITNFKAERITKDILDYKMTDLELIHFVCGLGILRYRLRDEIFCQICKQLIRNPNKTSWRSGWTLLALCLGCFHPSTKVYDFIKQFFHSAEKEDVKFFEARLQQTLESGSTRFQPPCALELESCQQRQDVELQVFLMTTAKVSVLVNSSSTSHHVCEKVATTINLKDPFGFAIYIGLHNQVSSLGSGRSKILDAVSMCEQYGFENSILPYEEVPWQLFFRKEIFAPIRDIAEDAVHLNLVYHQIVKGIKFQEYRCRTDADLALMAAYQYYIDHGVELDQDKLLAVLPIYIPDPLLTFSSPKQTVRTLEPKFAKHWLDLITHRFKQSQFIKDNTGSERIKAHVVKYAMDKWLLQFSAIFEAKCLTGREVDRMPIIIAVNVRGVYLLNGEHQVLQRIAFKNIVAVTSRHRAANGNFAMAVAGAQIYVFIVNLPQELRNLLLSINDYMWAYKAPAKFILSQEDNNGAQWSQC